MDIGVIARVTKGPEITSKEVKRFATNLADTATMISNMVLEKELKGINMSKSEMPVTKSNFLL